MAIISFSQLIDAGSSDPDDVLAISKPSATVTITAATISAQASDNSFNDSSGGFVTAGFAVGDRVTVSGFTGDTANNIFSGEITSLSAGAMIIGGADGDVIVDDAEGESVTITKWETYRITVQDILDLTSSGSNFSATDNVTGTSVTMAATWAGVYKRFTAAGAKVVNITADSVEAIAADSEFPLRNVGAADLTITPAGGVTVNPPSGGTLVVPSGGTVTIKRIAADEYDLIGQTTASA